MPDVGDIVLFEKHRLVIRCDENAGKWWLSMLDHAGMLNLQRNGHILGICLGIELLYIVAWLQ